MKTKHILVLVIALCSLKTAFSQDSRFSKEEAARVMNAYKRSSKSFMDLEVCGNTLDGPAYVMKEAENYSLDRLINITPQQEADLGRSIFNNSESRFVINDPSNTKMLTDIVARLSAHSSHPNTNYHVYIINSTQINAFSTIGGYIYVTSAMLNFVDTKDEMAFILGHEMSHIMLHHVVRKEKKIALITYAGQKMNYQKFSSVAINVDMTLSAPFDQIDEYEADKGGLQLVRRSGYDPTAFNIFFSKIEKYERKDLLSRFTSDHPASASRRKCLNKQLSEKL